MICAPFGPVSVSIIRAVPCIEAPKNAYRAPTFATLAPLRSKLTVRFFEMLADFAGVSPASRAVRNAASLVADSIARL